MRKAAYDKLITNNQSNNLKENAFNTLTSLSLQANICHMGLQLRITFKDIDYAYQIINSKLIDHNTTELELMLDGEKIGLHRDKTQGWIQKDAGISIDPELIQALGRSVSLRLRM